MSPSTKLRSSSVRPARGNTHRHARAMAILTSLESSGMRTACTTSAACRARAPSIRRKCTNGTTQQRLAESELGRGTLSHERHDFLPNFRNYSRYHDEVVRGTFLPGELAK